MHDDNIFSQGLLKEQCHGLGQHYAKCGVLEELSLQNIGNMLVSMYVSGRMECL